MKCYLTKTIDIPNNFDKSPRHRADMKKASPEFAYCVIPFIEHSEMVNIRNREQISGCQMLGIGVGMWPRGQGGR